MNFLKYYSIMKKYLHAAILLLLMVVTFVACSDDKEPQEVNYYYIEGTYTVDGKSDLSGSLDGVPLEKGEGSIELQVPDKDTDPLRATITLNNIIPGHNSVVFQQVELTESPDTEGLVFQSEKTENNTEISITGSVKLVNLRGSMNINILTGK